MTTLWHGEARPPFNKSLPTLPREWAKSPTVLVKDDSTDLEQLHQWRIRARQDGKGGSQSLSAPAIYLTRVCLASCRGNLTYDFLMFDFLMSVMDGIPHVFIIMTTATLQVFEWDFAAWWQMYKIVSNLPKAVL